MIRFENMPPEVMQAMCTPMHQILPSSAIPGPIALASARSSSSQSTQYPGRLYLGSLSALSDRSVLAAAGITHLVQVIDAPWLPLTEKDGFICHRINILDLPEADLGRFLLAACEWIDKALREGKGVLVHCQQGVSRSPAIVIAYLIRYHGLSYDAASAFVRRQRACIKPNSGFVESLREWERNSRPAVVRRQTTR